MAGGAEAVEWSPSVGRKEEACELWKSAVVMDGWIQGGEGPERWGKVEGDYKWSVFVCYCTDFLISHTHRVQTGDTYLDSLSE